jgi:hypothetical protein
MHPEARQSSSVYLEATLAPLVIKFCKTNGLSLDLTADIDLDVENDSGN